MSRRFRIVDTDNFGRDYPDEKFVGFPMSQQACDAVCYILNKEAGANSSRYYKTVPYDYKLVPGFEP